MARKKVVKKKLEIVFDPKKRREFLSGFQKRKNERRKRAKDQLEKSLKEERKRIRLEIKNGLKHMKKSFEPLKELTDKDKTNEEEYEDDDVKVKIVELSTNELAASNNFIGANQGDDSDDNDQDVESEASDNEEDLNRIPGMDFTIKPKKHREAVIPATEGGAHANIMSSKIASGGILKTKKELDKLKKTKTLNKLKKSKVFKTKERFDKKANQKQARRDKNNTIRSLPKHQRKQKKSEASRYRKGKLVNKKQMRRQLD